MPFVQHVGLWFIKLLQKWMFRMCMSCCYIVVSLALVSVRERVIVNILTYCKNVEQMKIKTLSILLSEYTVAISTQVCEAATSLPQHFGQNSHV